MKIERTGLPERDLPLGGEGTGGVTDEDRGGQVGFDFAFDAWAERVEEVRHAGTVRIRTGGGHDRVTADEDAVGVARVREGREAVEEPPVGGVVDADGPSKATKAPASATCR